MGLLACRDVRAAESCAITPQVDWNALGLDAAKSTFYAPAIAGFQSEASWKPDEAIIIEPGRGLLLVLDEVPRLVPEGSNGRAAKTP